MSINMLNKESVLFRSISSVSLLLSMYEISHYALHAAIIWLTKKLHVWLRSVRSFILSVFFWPNIATSYFSVSLKFGALCITGQWDGFRIKRQFFFIFYFFKKDKDYVCIYFFGILLLFFIIKFVYLLFSFRFLMNIKLSQQNTRTNQKQEFAVQNCQWNCMPQHFLNWNITLCSLRRFNITW